jgi:hypothetical protein
MWAFVFWLAGGAATVQGAWFDSAWPFRRPVEVTWAADKASGEELAEVTVDTAGHALADGADIRVAGEDGKLVPAEVLQVGPGDVAHVVFQLVKGQRRYAVYFGNPKPAPVPKNVGNIKWQYGLMLEMRRWSGGGINGFAEIERCWERKDPLIGRTMIDRPFLGVNPFGEQQQTMLKLTGSVFAPMDGEYQFAATADDRGALYIDGKPLVYAPAAVTDIRFNKKVSLKRGRHLFEFYEINTGGDMRFTVGWKRPDQAKVEVMGREAFGLVAHGRPGALEEIKKTLVADFGREYLGECFIDGNWSHRVKFTAQGAKNATYRWDLGDGQSASGASVEHVYVMAGVYPVRVTAAIGTNHDTQTTKVSVTRDWPNLAHAKEDAPATQAKSVADYDVAKLPAAWLPWAAWLEQRAGNEGAMRPILARLAKEPAHADDRNSLAVLDEAAEALLKKGQVPAVVALWASVPAGSDLQPSAAKRQGLTLLWWGGDPEKAAAALRPFIDKDGAVKRAYGQALVLSGQASEGKKILNALPPQGPAERQAALSGAAARTIEAYLGDKDWESGQEAWDRWQAQFPAEFLEGYSLLLKVRLMEVKGASIPAAGIAEAFARAVPTSSYAPTLLDKASHLLEKSDPARARQLRELLKQKYPEDPLSQDTR